MSASIERPADPPATTGRAAAGAMERRAPPQGLTGRGVGSEARRARQRPAQAGVRRATKASTAFRKSSLV